MRTRSSIGEKGLAVVGMLTIAASANAQRTRGGAESTIEFVAGQPQAAALVRNQPYSGEATTTVTQTLADGTRIERTTTTRVFRDSEGRVRREQTVQGLGPLNPGGETTLTTIIDPVAGVSYVLEASSRRAHRAPLTNTIAAARQELQRVERKVEEAMAARGRSGQSVAPPPPAPVAPYSGVADPLAPPPPPPPPPEAGARGRGANPNAVPNMPQALGTRQIEGLETIGTRRVEVLPVGRIGNDRPIEIVDERWESPALKILVQSRHSDPRTGVVEYRLMNVSRAEPTHDLFVVPPDYTIVDARDER